MLTRIEHNPDVLSCLANLSSDEVFTPPALANRMLDLLPGELWRNPEATFLDPAVKSGVFLREIARRLMVGLAEAIPDAQARRDHIFGKQLYGLAITELTALLARRSLYCSKAANGQYSVAGGFRNEDGNIQFERIEHTWKSGKCVHCGASESEYARGAELESHAYQFIHMQNPAEVLGMKFDVIIGNPPYQLSDGGFGRSASPIYHKFVHQAKKLEPRYLVMIIPSRWFAGGKGLDTFRKEMLEDDRIRKIVDYEDATEIFPGVDIAGGVCYFLWDRDNRGQCEITNVHNETRYSSTRPLNEFDTLVRHSAAVGIIRKVLSQSEVSLSTQVSSAKPFGLRTFVRPSKEGELRLRWNGGEGAFKREDVPYGHEMIDQWKVITSKVSYDHAGQPDKNGMRRVFSIVDILPPGTICTETYLVVGTSSSKQEAKNLESYLRTKFARFLVAQLSFSQDIFKEKFQFVPLLDMEQEWRDQSLYERYGLTEEEIGVIESRIRPMEPNSE